MLEWYNIKRITVHFIKLLVLLAILLWISSFFRPFNREVESVAANKWLIKEMPFALHFTCQTHD